MAFMVPEYVYGDFAEGETYEGAWLIPWEHRSDVEWTERPEKVRGWFARLSAPGYLDATDWWGPFDSESEAREYIAENYDVDPHSGDPLDGPQLGYTNLYRMGWSLGVHRAPAGYEHPWLAVGIYSTQGGWSRREARELRNRQLAEEEGQLGCVCGSQLGLSQDLWTRLNWMDRDALSYILEQHGFAVHYSESEQDLREAIAENIDDGTIPESALLSVAARW
jgi:hypothetical protein